MTRLFLFAICFASVHSWAQEEEKQGYYFFDHNQQEHYYPDTSITNFEEHNLVQGGLFESFNIGNTGLSAYSLFYNEKGTGFNSGFDQHDVYRLEIDSIHYFRAYKPYSDLRMMIGLRQELIVEGEHAQSLRPWANFGLRFRRISSTGTLPNQNSLNNSFNAYYLANSNNKRYQFVLNGSYNSFKNSEYGGAEFDFIDDTTTQVVTNLLIPTQLQNAESIHKEFEIGLNNSYFLGQKYSISINDSTDEDAFASKWKIDHNLSFGKETMEFFDSDPDSTYYNEFYINDDSMDFNYKHNLISTGLSLSFTGVKNVANEEIQQTNVLFNAGIMLDNYFVAQRSRTGSFNNVYIQGGLKNNPLSASKLRYKAKGKYYLSGYNANDLEIQLKLGYDLKEFGELELGYGITNKSPSWIQNNYQSNSVNWRNDFANTQSNTLGGKYSLPKYKFSFGADYYNLNNYLFWNSNAEPQQGGNVSLLQIYLIKNFKRGWFNFNNVITTQLVDDQSLIQLPAYRSVHSLFYQNIIFGGVLQTQLGVDVRFNSSFNAPSFNPVIGQFYLQNEKQMDYYPVVDLFLNLKVQTVRISAKIQNLSQGIWKRNYYTANLYPAQNRSFKVNIAWRFME